jgi:hypothetical protein
MLRPTPLPKEAGWIYRAELLGLLVLCYLASLKFRESMKLVVSVVSVFPVFRVEIVSSRVFCRQMRWTLTDCKSDS